jgi:hypothetical protein
MEKDMMKLENLGKITKLSNELSRLNGMIGQSLPNTAAMNVDLCINASTTQFYFDVRECPPETIRAIADVIISELQKKRDAVAEELRGLGVDV